MDDENTVIKILSLDKEAAIDEALGLQAISIRLQKDIIQKLKVFAKEEGLGYQPLIRQILTRYVRDKSLDLPEEKLIVTSPRSFA